MDSGILKTAIQYAMEFNNLIRNTSAVLDVDEKWLKEQCKNYAEEHPCSIIDAAYIIRNQITDGRLSEPGKETP